MKHVFFALYDGDNYTRIETSDVNYYLARTVDVYAVVINLRDAKGSQRIELAEGVYIDLSAYVSCLELSDNLMRLTVTYYVEGCITGRFTKEYDIDESQITRVKL